MKPNSLEQYFTAKGCAIGKPRIIKPFHRKIFKALEQCAAGTLPNGAINLGIFIPPRHGKTFIIQDFIEWCFGWFPDSRWIYSTYSQDLSIESSLPILQSLQSDWYKRIFPWGVIDSTCKMTEARFKTAHDGGLLAVGVGGAFGGFGAGQKRAGFAGANIIDDPIKLQDFRSPNVRKSCVNWYTGTLSSRENKAETPKILIMQRGHPEDLAGHVEKEERHLWHFVKIPAIQGNIDSDDCQVLWPGTKSLESLRLLKQVDSQAYHAQYQQEPQIEGGNMIKADWWQRHDWQPIDGNNPPGMLFMTADTAYKDTKNADASTLQLWSATQKYLDLIAIESGRWEFLELLSKARAMYAAWEKHIVKAMFIENKASGASLEQTLRTMKIPAIAWNPLDYKFPDNKVARVRESLWYIHGGRVRLPRYLNMQGFIDECSAFSEDMSQAHDDQVDGMTMAVSIWRYYGGGSDVTKA